MFYKVVVQGRTLAGAEVVAVKREFLRITGLPETFVEHLFEGMPQVVKRQVPRRDAERIAATLRAIGAAATVERELQVAEEETPEGIRIEANPLSGPPSVIPGMAGAAAAPAPSRHSRVLRTLREKLPLIVGSLVVIGLAVVATPFVEAVIRTLRPPQPPAAVVVPKPAAPTPEAVAAVAPLNQTLLHGPWRCVDQNGTPHYWTYDADGVLINHGDVFKEGAPAKIAASASMKWKVEGRRLLHSSLEQATDAYAVTDLTLMRLRYGNEKGLDIQCRRP